MVSVFPQGGLDASVITTVWVGVWVLCLFNLRFGWTLSGLVVPGYLVPLLLLKPWIALVVIGEALVTYLVARALSDLPVRIGWWSGFFGRDRMMLVLIVAVAVRLVFDTWLLPEVGAYANTHYGVAFDYRNNLHSFGLVIGALIANQLWKPGLLRGLGPLSVTIGVTYLIVRFGLMEWTNFNIGSLGYMYDDVATSMLASPKSYVILLFTAMWASRMNLVYGWDFNGILIPSLLALQWYQPSKIFTSFLEAWVIVGLAILVLRIPLLQQVTIEKARKLLLFFNISFVYKLALGFLVLRFSPDFKITDTYGFGYLLPTLMAVRIHDKQFGLLFTRATVQTSLMGLTLASVVGFSLTFLTDPWTGTEASADLTRSQPLIASRHPNLGAALDSEEIRLYSTRIRSTFATPLESELAQYSAGLEQLAEYAEDAMPGSVDDERLHEAVEILNRINYQVELVEERYLLVTEREPSRGWGFAVIDSAASSGLNLEVPAPLDEPGTLDAGETLFTRMGGRVLLVAGASRHANRDGGADVLRNRATAYHVAHRTLGRRDVLQIRADSDETDSRSVLWVQGALPSGLDLPLLESLMGDYAVQFAKRSGTNAQRQETSYRFGELVLTPAQLTRLTTAIGGQMPEELHSSQRIDGYLREWLLESDMIAERGTDTYVAPTLGELMFFDEEIFKPILELVNTEVEAGTSPRWSSVCASAEFLGYRIIHYRQESPAQSFFILAETARPLSRHRGTYVFRAGAVSPYILQVPRPGLEARTLEFGVSLFEQLQARALFVAGAHPFANRDGSADMVAARNKESVFSLASQAVVREAADDARIAVQVRAVCQSAEREQSGVDLLVALSEGKADPSRLSPLDAQLLDELEGLGLTAGLVDGSLQTAGYEAERSFQSRYMDTAINKSFAAVWLTTSARSSYASVQRYQGEQAKFLALGIETVVGTLRRVTTGAHSSARRAPRTDELSRLLTRYFSSQDMVLIARIRSQWPELRLQRLFDRDLQQSFLLVYHADGALAMVANLLPKQPAAALTTRRGDAPQLDAFLSSGAAFLHLEGSP